MKIWAHRGCSQLFPENTMLAFEKAADIRGLTGIELDIQLTRDGQVIVMHDERVDRTTDGTGEVQSFTFESLRKLRISSDNGFEQIPSVEEVLDLLDDRFKEGLLLNIELKNSVFPYDGMEQKIIELVHKKGIAQNIVYSSFSAISLSRIKQIDPDAETGILDKRVSDCLYKMKGGCGADSLHPFWRGIDLPKEMIGGYTVRAWFTGHLYPEKPTGTMLSLEALEKQGITDVFLNEPERYLK